MKLMRNRILALLLALVLCVGLLPAAALAEDEDAGTIEPVDETDPVEGTGTIAPADDPGALPSADDPEEVYSGTCGDNLTWSFEETTGVLTISGTGDMYNFLYDYRFDSSTAPWFLYGSSITSIVLPDRLTRIGDNAFYYCIALTNITIPESVTGIGNNAFYGCSSLTSVTIPESVTDMGRYSFWCCSKLETAGPLDGDYNIRFGWTKKIPDNAFHYCNAITSITIPEGVTSIGKSAFEECEKLNSITIPDGVESIGVHAFSGCNVLSEITLPDGLVRIGSGAFWATNLVEIVFPASLRECDTMETGDPVFGDTPLENIYVSQDSPYYCSIDGVLFSKDQKTLVMFPCGRSGMYTVPDGVCALGAKAFCSSNLSVVSLPDSLTTIEDRAFCWCRMLNIIYNSNNVVSIGDRAFSSARILWAFHCLRV